MHEMNEAANIRRSFSSRFAGKHFARRQAIPHIHAAGFVLKCVEAGKT
jgi:hypothetical protein